MAPFFYLLTDTGRTGPGHWDRLPVSPRAGAHQITSSYGVYEKFTITTG